MTTTPIYYENNPASDHQYWSHMWCGVVSSGESLSVTVKCYTGTNGSGSLDPVSSMKAIVWDQTSNTQVGSFTGYNVDSVTATVGSTTSGHWYKVSVVYSGGGISSISMQMTYSTSTPFVPTTPSFSPSSGGPGTVVTITGSLFTDFTFVNFNGVAASSTTFISDTHITATVPPGASTGVITVGNPAGSSNSAGSYLISQAWVNTGTPASPVWSAAVVYINTGTPASPVWTVATEVAANTGTPASPTWTPGG